ncbi:MAG: HlyD family secretion protein [Planctomycetota bacterium]
MSAGQAKARDQATELRTKLLLARIAHENQMAEDVNRITTTGEETRATSADVRGRDFLLDPTSVGTGGGEAAIQTALGGSADPAMVRDLAGGYRAQLELANRQAEAGISNVEATTDRIEGLLSGEIDLLTSQNALASAQAYATRATGAATEQATQFQEGMGPLMVWNQRRELAQRIQLGVVDRNEAEILAMQAQAFARAQELTLMAARDQQNFTMESVDAAQDDLSRAQSAYNQALATYDEEVKTIMTGAGGWDGMLDLAGKVLGGNPISLPPAQRRAYELWVQILKDTQGLSPEDIVAASDMIRGVNYYAGDQFRQTGAAIRGQRDMMTPVTMASGRLLEPFPKSQEEMQKYPFFVDSPVPPEALIDIIRSGGATAAGPVFLRYGLPTTDEFGDTFNEYVQSILIPRMGQQTGRTLEEYIAFAHPVAKLHDVPQR